MVTQDEINAYIQGMTFGQKREALSDWDWWFRKRMATGFPLMDFRDWLAEQVVEKIEREAEKHNAHFAMDAAEFAGTNLRIARPSQLWRPY